MKMQLSLLKFYLTILISEQKARRIRGKPQHATFRRFVQEYLDETTSLIDRLLAQEITADEFGQEFQTILEYGHSEAFALGRQRAGDLVDVLETDVMIGRRLAQREKTWIYNFVQDLKSTWALDPATGKASREKIIWRSSLYLRKFRGTANEAFVRASDEEETFDWLLGATERHCNECPRIAAGSPYKRSQITRQPGDGKTPCLGNCLCRWRRHSDGLYGFNPISIRDGKVVPAKVR